MPEKDISIWHFVVVGLMGLWGAIVSIVDKVKYKKIKQIDVITFLGEVSASLFATYAAFFICVGLGFHPYYAVGMGGLAGHYGPRTLFIARKWWLDR